MDSAVDSAAIDEDASGRKFPCQTHLSYPQRFPVVEHHKCDAPIGWKSAIASNKRQNSEEYIFSVMVVGVPSS